MSERKRIKNIENENEKKKKKFESLAPLLSITVGPTVDAPCYKTFEYVNEWEYFDQQICSTFIPRGRG